MITIFDSFILENNRVDTTPLTDDDVKHIISENCKDFSFKDKAIYRGIYLDEKSYLIDPKKYHRLSANADNYYNMIMDGSESWKKYPQRKHSLIGSFMYYQTIPYGTTFRIIPFDGAKFGVVPHGEDMWNSFRYLYEKTGINELNYVDVLIDDFHVALFKEKLNNRVYNVFVKQLKNIENEIKKNYNDSQQKIFKYYGYANSSKNIHSNPFDGFIVDSYIYGRVGSNFFKKFFYYISEQIVMKNKTLLWILEDLLSPVKNKFELLDYKSLINRKGVKSDSVPEVWTDSKCLLINEQEYKINNLPGSLVGFKL